MKLNATFLGFVEVRKEINAEIHESEPTFGMGIES